MPVIELYSERGRDRVIRLLEPRYLVGADAAAVHIVIEDPAVSGVHAELTQVGSTWLVCDLGSRNGTRLGNELLTGQRQMRDGDELRLGHTRLIFRDTSPWRRTDLLDGPPDNITRAEKKVLVELCRPKLAHNTFQTPASVREIGERLYITRNAVQFHLANLYDKFGIFGGEGLNRRVELANEAMDRGAVSYSDLNESDGDGSNGDD